MKNISKQINKIVPPGLKKLIRTIAEEADKEGIELFIVGGFVRDILLGRENYDLDLVVETDATKFGKVLSEVIGGTLVVHKRFGTATIVKERPRWMKSSLRPEDKFKIDIATARKEKYEKPAALPDVEFSSLREDLYRRDFTINAMAVKINRSGFGTLIDFFDGKKDLVHKSIRVLHDRSFIDDPTRIFRAVRFEQRLSFRIEKHTEYLITHAVSKDMFHHTENQRIKDELILILKEARPEKAVFRMNRLHELRFIHPDMSLKKNTGQGFRALREAIRWYERYSANPRKLNIWVMNFMLMTDALSIGHMKDILDKFSFTRSENLKLTEFKKYGREIIKILSSRKKLLPGEIYEILNPISTEVIICLMSKTGSVNAIKRIKAFIRYYDGTLLEIKGEDIKKHGIAPGPEYQEILRTILHKKLEGKLPGKKHEAGYLREIAGKYRREDV